MTKAITNFFTFSDTARYITIQAFFLFCALC